MLDALIIGGGAAGLAAGAELARAGASFILLEARARLGGRAWTSSDEPGPVELGAEFVHGRPEPVLEELRRAGLHALPVEGAGDDEYWSGIEDALGRVKGSAPDRSFADALRLAPGLTPGSRAAAAAFVAGFHAADPRRISAWEVAEETTQGAAESFRIPEGYGALIGALSARIPRGSINLEAPVSALRWGRGRVVASSGRARFEARTALITIPVGVLKAGALLFDPPLPGAKLAALARLGMGDVAKVGLLFDPEDHRLIARALEDGFLRDERGPFGVYWTAAPLGVPLITAWSGGPPARGLNRRSVRAVAAAAIRGLARAAGLSERDVRRAVRRVYYHNWSEDPYARGAYSYAAPGGLSAREELGRPVDAALFFAGEACALGGASGTVAGAIETGRDAARKILDSRRPAALKS